MKSSDNHSLLGLYTIGIAALFLAGFFMLVIFGAQTYRKTVEQQTHNNENRTFRSYITNSVGSGDAEGAVRIESGTVQLKSSAKTGAKDAGKDGGSQNAGNDGGVQNAGNDSGSQDTEIYPVLVIADGDSAYALRIYQYEGMLLEDYARATSPLRPDDAGQIAQTQLFEVEEYQPGTLRFTTDEGSFLVRLRSGSIAGSAAGNN